MAIVYDFSVSVDTVAKTGRLVNNVDFLTDYGIDVVALGGSVTGSITGPDGVALITGQLIDLTTGNNGLVFNMPLDDDDEILNGAYTYTTYLTLSASALALFNIVAPNIINVDEGYVGLTNFFIAGNSVTVDSGTNAGVKTVVSTAADTVLLAITVSQTLTNEDPAGTLTFSVTNPALTDSVVYSGCDEVTPTVTVTDDCYSTQFGTIAFQDTTALPSNYELTTRLWSIAYPSNLSPPPATNPITGSTSVMNFTELAIGQWNYRLTQTVAVTQDDGLIYTYVATTGAIPYDVECNGVLCEVSCCYQTLYNRYAQDIAASGTSPLTNLMIELATLNNLAVNKKDCGDKAAADAIIQQMSDLIEASGACADDCGCGTDTGNRWVNNAGFSAETLLESIIASIQYKLFAGVPDTDQNLEAGYEIGSILQDINTGIEYRLESEDVSGDAVWVVYYDPSAPVESDQVSLSADIPELPEAGNVQEALEELAIRVPYLSYVAKVTQTSTNAPVLTVLQNNIGATISSAYDSTGVYQLIASAAVLTANKTFINFTTPVLYAFIDCQHSSDTTIGVETYTATESASDELLNCFVEIRIYP